MHPGAYHLVIAFYLQVEPMVRRQAHRHAAEAVTSGGMLLIVGHDLDDLTRGVGGCPSTKVLLTVERVVEILAGTGLESECSAQGGRDVEQDDGAVHPATDRLVRARRPTGT